MGEFREHSVTSDDSVDYPHPDELRGHAKVEHKGRTAKCPICQHQFVPDEVDEAEADLQEPSMLPPGELGAF